jgi:hypothetical protein
MAAGPVISLFALRSRSVVSGLIDPEGTKRKQNIDEAPFCPDSTCAVSLAPRVETCAWE